MSLCQNEQCSKDGIVGGRQRYRCKNCNHRHTVAYKWYSEAVKRQAWASYLEGLGFRSIGRLLNCSHVAFYQWIKHYGEQARLDELPATELEAVEMDERHPSVGSKKNACWLGIAVDRTGKRFLNVVIGDRSTDTGQCLWEGVAHHDIGNVMTDYWQPYQLFIPPEIQSQSKAQTFTVEGYNSLFRHCPLGYAVNPNVILSL